MKKTVVIILSALVLSLVAISCGSGSGGNTPSKAVLKFFEYIKSKDYDKATKLFYLKEGEKLSEGEVQKVKALLILGQEDYEKKGGIKEIKILSETIDESGDSGSVRFDLTFGNGNEETRNFNLKKIDNSWKIKAM